MPKFTFVFDGRPVGVAVELKTTPANFKATIDLTKTKTQTVTIDLTGDEEVKTNVSKKCPRVNVPTKRAKAKQKRKREKRKQAARPEEGPPVNVPAGLLGKRERNDAPIVDNPSNEQEFTPNGTSSSSQDDQKVAQDDQKVAQDDRKEECFGCTKTKDPCKFGPAGCDKAPKFCKKCFTQYVINLPRNKITDHDFRTVPCHCGNQCGTQIPSCFVLAPWMIEQLRSVGQQPPQPDRPTQPTGPNFLVTGRKRLEEQLNLRAPCCKQPYDPSFDGCGAVQCNCGQKFCCFCHWCSCDNDAVHQHVRECRSKLAARAPTEKCNFLLDDEEIENEGGEEGMENRDVIPCTVHGRGDTYWVHPCDGLPECQKALRVKQARQELADMNLATEDQDRLHLHILENVPVDERPLWNRVFNPTLAALDGMSE